MSAKIITLDIETAPIESYHWGLFDQNIGLDQIKVDWSILAYCAKPLGSNDIIYADTGGRGKQHVRNDSRLLKQLWDILDDADIVIAQNGARFDVPKINARLIEHGYGPYSDIRVIDTLQVSRRYFGFTSNKLAWTSRLTGQTKSEHRKYPGFELWKECLEDTAEAWAEMKKYNIQDVRATEALYLKQRPWIKNHPNLEAYRDVPVSISQSSQPAPVQPCGKCGGTTKSRGIVTTQNGQYQQRRCVKCGAYSRGKQNLIPLATRKQFLT